MTNTAPQHPAAQHSHNQADPYPDLTEKPFSEKLRLADAMYQLEQAKAQQRKQDPQHHAGQGSARNIIGSKLGWSGEKFRQARKVWLAAQHSPWAQRLVTAIEDHNRAINRAYRQWNNPWLDVVFDDLQQAVPTLERNSIDFILADPPYNVDFTYEDYDDDRPDAAYQAWVQAWLTDCYQVLTDGGYAVVFVGEKSLPQAIKAVSQSPFTYHHTLTWQKPGGQGNVPGTNLFNRKEQALVLSKGDYDFHGNNNDEDILIDDVISVPPKSPGDPPTLVHDCPRPIELYECLIQFFTDTGDIVLDPFLGSGTTAVAGLTTGRNVKGIELTDKYRSDMISRLQHSLDDIDMYQRSFSGTFVSHTRGDSA